MTFTLAGIRSGADGSPAVLYDIVTSASSIVKRKDGSFSVNAVSASRTKTVNGQTEKTNDGILKYSIDGNAETAINNDSTIEVSSVKDYIKFTLYDSAGAILDRETVPIIVDGIDGEGMSLQGRWKTGIVVPYLGVVQMGGSSWSAKVATSNPPMWCWTDENGNRLLFDDGSYILTGDENTTEYQKVASDGATGATGAKGDTGDTGGPGQQGIQGCIIRDSEWAIGVEFRNDEALTSGTRYIDVALVRDESAATGWTAFKCKKTHISSTSITTSNTTYWEEFAANVTAIFTSLIIAKNAKITFLQGNQLLIQKSNGVITAGISGSESGNKVRFWAGSETPDNAPFQVEESGKLVATKAEITGEVNATSGVFENVTISGSLRTPWKQLRYKCIYSSADGDVYGFDGSAVYDDKIEVFPVVSCELMIGWGTLADGREIAVRVSNKNVYLKVPTDYFAIDYEGNKISEGTNLYLQAGYIHYLTGCRDCWVVNRRISIVG